MSLPFSRMMVVRQARPNLASAAEKVRKIIMDVMSGLLVRERERGYRGTSVRANASSERRAIRRCFRWETRLVIVASLVRGSKEERGVGMGLLRGWGLLKEVGSS